METLKENNRKTVVRICGGWVRDKMMGKESNDIDMALDDMYGEELATMIRQKMEKENPDQKKPGYGVIKNNSDKSKHLEVAVIKLFDQFIDIVNLRSEEYAQDSRVPTIKIGTPEQDAERRDLTFNSLFYNVNEQKIEDYTNKGIDDLI